MAYIYSDTGYVQFGFFNGSSLKDPKGLLEGKGKYVRHVKVRDRSAIDEQAFPRYSGKPLVRARNHVPPLPTGCNELSAALSAAEPERWTAGYSEDQYTMSCLRELEIQGKVRGRFAIRASQPRK